MGERVGEEGEFNETARRKLSFVKHDIPQDVGLLNPMAYKKVAKKTLKPALPLSFSLDMLMCV